MAEKALLPCIVCGTVLRNVVADVDNQPSEGTEFTSYGHYGSTFWDSFAGEELVLNVCDLCLAKYKDRLGRHKRYVKLVADDPRYKMGPTVGRQWVERALVPYFEGPEDEDSMTIEPEQIGVLDRKGEGGYGRIEWVEDWRETKGELVDDLRELEQGHPCRHELFVAECLECGATPLQGLR